MSNRPERPSAYARTHKRSPKLVRELLRNAFQKFGLDRQLDRYQFVLHWREIVGDEIARLSKPESIHGKALVVRVSNSAWAQELSFQKQIILKRLRKFIPSDNPVQDIVFRVG